MGATSCFPFKEVNIFIETLVLKQLFKFTRTIPTKQFFLKKYFISRLFLADLLFQNKYYYYDLNCLNISINK